MLLPHTEWVANTEYEYGRTGWELGCRAEQILPAARLEVSQHDATLALLQSDIRTTHQTGTRGCETDTGTVDCPTACHDVRPSTRPSFHSIHHSHPPHHTVSPRSSGHSIVHSPLALSTPCPLPAARCPLPHLSFPSLVLRSPPPRSLRSRHVRRPAEQVERRSRCAGPRGESAAGRHQSGGGVGQSRRTTPKGRGQPAHRVAETGRHWQTRQTHSRVRPASVHLGDPIH